MSPLDGVVVADVRGLLVDRAETGEEAGIPDDAAPPLARGRGANEARGWTKADEDELEDMVREVLHGRRSGLFLLLFGLALLAPTTTTTSRR